MKQLVIISGKGGTGKTTVTGALGTLAADLVLSDADVEAPDLHLIVRPKIIEKEPFIGMSKAKIDPDRCSGCWRCIDVCRFEAIVQDGEVAKVDKLECESCHACGLVCPESAISYEPSRSGETFLSDTRWGPMSHAQLKMGEETSGRIVAVVRENAKKLSKKDNKSLVLIDGPPGIGCPVIATLSNLDYVITICEPTPSALHDLLRVIEVINQFNIPFGILINKSDLQSPFQKTFSKYMSDTNYEILGKIPFDLSIPKAMSFAKPVVQYAPDSKASLAIKEIYTNLKRRLWDQNKV